MKKNEFLQFKYSFALIFTAVAILYADTASLFFYYDDFERLRDVIEGEGNTFFIFTPIYRPGVVYFTPIFYLFFGSCYKLFGLNPVPFHLMILITHIVNSCLVCYFAFLISRTVSLATIIGFVFAVNFTAADNVVWPSTYADQIMFFFSIMTLIGFYKYIESNKIGWYVLCVACFILALASKIQTMFLPFGLISIELLRRFSSGSFELRLGILTKYLPFVIFNMGYLILINVLVPQFEAASIIDANRFLSNLFIIPMLYIIPEGLQPNSPIHALLIDVVIVSVVLFICRNKKEMMWLGFSLLLVGILALIPLKWNFPLYPDPLNESIKHRLYFGNIGYAFLLGTMIYEAWGFAANKSAAKIFLVCCISIFFVLNLIFLNRIKSEFIKVTSDTEKAVKRLKTIIRQIPADKRNIYIVNFPPKQGFGISLQQLFLNIRDLSLGSWPSPIPEGFPEDKLQIYLQLNGNIYESNNITPGVALTAWDHFYAAQFYLLIGKQAEAMNELQTASSKSAWGDGRLHYKVGVTYLKVEEKEKAIKELNMAISKNKRLPEPFSLLGTLYFEKGDYSRAIDNFELSLKANPEDFKIMEDLALIYESQGRIKKSRELFKKALLLENRPEVRRMIEEKLIKQ